MTGGRNGAAFVHQASVYGSQDEFLAMAVPFVEDGLSRGEPVLATTTSANLALLGENLGEGWQRVDQAESAYFGRRTSQRVAAFDRYWRRQAPAGGHVRILAEPIWSGRSDHEVAAWARMESTLNVVLSATNIWMICPYDTRVVSPEVVAGARRTHPTRMQGITAEPCPSSSTRRFSRAPATPTRCPTRRRAPRCWTAGATWPVCAGSWRSRRPRSGSPANGPICW